MPATHAETDDLEQATGFRAIVDVGDGLRRFTDWLVAYYSGPGR